MINLDIRKNRELEQKIISLAEEFVQNIIKASLKDADEKAFILENAQNLILELSELIHALIQDEEHLESMLNQLISQKFPDEHVLDSFEDFEEMVSELIQEGVDRYRLGLNDNRTDEDTSEEEISILPEAIHANNTPIDKKEETDKFIIQIKTIFPSISVEKNVHYRGIKLQYYIPELKMILELQDNNDNLGTIKGFKDLVAEKEGLKIVKVPLDCSSAKLKKLITTEKILENF